MSEKLNIALCQITVGDGEWESNVDRGMQALERAAWLGADVAVLPELWSSGYDLSRAEEWAERNGPLIDKVAAACRTHGLYAVAGSFIMKYDDGGLRNCLVAFDPDEDKLTTYGKMHLFPGLGEPDIFTPGDEPALWSTPFGTFGLALCYDLRFPDIFRAYFHERTPIVFLPAQWPYPRIEHWRLQLRARAVENQFFIAAVNSASRPAEDRLHGFSAIYDPWAEPVVELGHDEQIIVATVDLARCVEVEELLPLRNDLHPRFKPKS